MKFLALAGVILCSACGAQSGQMNALQQFTTADLAGASAIAAAAGDTRGSACWGYVGSIVTAVPGTPGVATAIEIRQVMRQPSFISACAGTLPLVVVNP